MGSTPKQTPWTVALSAMTSDKLKCGEFQEIWADWTAHRQEIKKPLTPTSIKIQIRKLEKMGFTRAMAALEHSIGIGYRGIFEPDGAAGEQSTFDDELAKVQAEEPPTRKE